MNGTHCKGLLLTGMLATTVALTGCGVGTMATPSAGAANGFSGRVTGGQQPIEGATILLYQAGTSGNGAGASNLLTTTVRTAADGTFNITNDYTCPSSTTQMYLVASGGNPGLAPGTSNASSLLMTALGDCSNLTPTTFISVNEVTTVAAAWALAPFAAPGGILGAASTNATGLRNAFVNARILANTSNGLAGGDALPAGARLEAAKLYTLADAISVCVNSSGNTCGPLFAAGTAAGVAPTNTFDSAVNIVRNPGANVAAVFNLTNAQAPFRPTLVRAPNDWTMSITHTGGGLSSPTALGVDSTGAIWAANYNGYSTSKFSAAGLPAAPNGFLDAALYESYGLAIDPSDNAWVTNQERGPTFYGSVTKFTSGGQVVSGAGITAGGIFYPYSIAADSNGHMWVADFGDSTASLLANDGTSLAGAGYSSSSLPLPLSVALDGAHNAWFAAQGSAVKVTPAGVISQFNCCVMPSWVALDPAGNVWISDYSRSSLVQLNSSGSVLQTLSGAGGLYFPESVVADGAGNIWNANFHGKSISEFGAASSGAASAILSPSTGFGVDAGLSEPFGMALDSSGDVWVSNFAGNSLTEFVGLATPIRTPLLGLPVQP